MLPQLRTWFLVILWALVQLFVMVPARAADEFVSFTAEDTSPLLMNTSHEADLFGLRPIAELAQAQHQHHASAPAPEETLETVEFDPHQAHDPAQPATYLSPQDMMMIEMMCSGSGTGWQPMDNPLLMQMNTFGPWMTMLHWSAFLDYTNQGGPRGSSRIVSRNWAMQASYGFFREPEALEPGNVHRLTSSVQHIRTTDTGWWATTLVFGHNLTEEDDENGIVLESTLNFRERNYLYGRVENVYKHGLFQEHDEAHESFNITAFTLGVARDLLRFRGIPLTLGGQVTVYAKPSRLDEAYGDFPVSFHTYLHTNAPASNATFATRDGCRV